MTMAKHFVAVCVVCLLCADHLPCKTHIEGLTASAAGLEYGGEYLRRAHPALDGFSADVVGGPVPVMAADKDLSRITHTRRKRHSHHKHTEEEDKPEGVPINDNSRRYLEQIFDRFGDGEAKTMDLGGFESMLEHLGLTNLLVHKDEYEEEEQDHHHHHSHQEEEENAQNSSVSRS